MVTIQLEATKERELWELATAQGQEPGELARRAVEEYLRRRHSGEAPHEGVCLPIAEAQLLQEINRGLPETAWRRYHELVARRRAETLTEEEYGELISLTDEVELANARRMEKLAHLARLRRVSLDQLMDELGFQDPGYA